MVDRRREKGRRNLLIRRGKAEFLEGRALSRRKTDHRNDNSRETKKMAAHQELVVAFVVTLAVASDNLVNDPVFQRLRWAHEEVPIGVGADPVDALGCMLRQKLGQRGLYPEDLFGSDFNI